jgi:hypothetical protein
MPAAQKNDWVFEDSPGKSNYRSCFKKREKNLVKQRGLGEAYVVEYLLSKCKALGSVPSTAIYILKPKVNKSFFLITCPKDC